jgi:hypothetical protein
MSEENGIVVNGKTEEAVVAPGELEHAEIRKRVRDLKDRAQENYWALSIELVQVYDGDLYRSWGFDSWIQYVQEELDIDKRTAQYLVKVQKWLDRMTPQIRDWAKSLGWTKARMIMHVVDKSNATEWKHRLDGKTVKQIQDILDAEKEPSAEPGGVGGEPGDPGVGGETVERTRKRSFALYSEQDELVTKALNKAKEEAQSEREGNLLTLICTDYLANNTDIFSRDDYLKMVEKNLGIRIVAMQPNDDPDVQDPIVYGHDYLNEEENPDGIVDEPTEKWRT